MTTRLLDMSSLPIIVHRWTSAGPASSKRLTHEMEYPPTATLRLTLAPPQTPFLGRECWKSLAPLSFESEFPGGCPSCSCLCRQAHSASLLATSLSSGAFLREALADHLTEVASTELFPPSSTHLPSSLHCLKVSCSVVCLLISCLPPPSSLTAPGGGDLSLTSPLFSAGPGTQWVLSRY